MIRLDGKEVSLARREKLKKELEAFYRQTQVRPGLAVVLVGEDPASQVYVGGKVKACNEVGMASFKHHLSPQTTSDQLNTLIEELNRDPAVHGILVQLPLPKHLNEDQILGWLNPAKDVDGLKPESMGLLWVGKPMVTPCTPAGVMAILEHYHLPVSGLRAVVVGRSQIVGKPMAHLLSQADATVTICHSRTKDLRSHTREADLVVVAAGRPRMLGREDFKQGAIVVDVGIHRQPGADVRSQLCGDVRYEELEGWAKAATPVPGGVGPMTITMLLENVLRLAKRSTLGQEGY